MRKLIIFYLVILNITDINSQNFYLDTSFGNNGVLVDTSVSNIPINVYYENNYYYLINQNNNIVCLNYNGSKNTSFGNNGVLNFNISGHNYVVKGSKLNNGFIYIYGTVLTNDDDIFIAKISLNGQLDSSFGVNGVLVQNIGNSDAELNDILFLGDDKIMGIGTKTDSNSHLFLSKYYSNGTIDFSFDTNGYKTPIIPLINWSKGANLFNFQNNILAVGNSFYSENSGTFLHHDLLLISIDLDGNLITNFGDNGIKREALSSLNTIGSFKVFNATLINNELFFSTYFGFSLYTQFYTLRKYNFTNDIISEISNLPFMYPSYVVDNNQKIYITGSETCPSITSSNCPRDFNLYRKNINGTPDTSFNSGGIYTYNFFPSDFFSDDRSSVFYLHNDGKIFLAGNGYNPSSNGTGLEMLRLTDVQLSVENQSQMDKEFILFPNPTINLINIYNSSDIKIEKIEIYDVNGRTVNFINDNNKTINIENLEASIYTIKIVLENQTLNYKIIKK